MADKTYTLNNGVTIPAIGECRVGMIMKPAPDGITRRQLTVAGVETLWKNVKRLHRLSGRF